MKYILILFISFVSFPLISQVTSVNLLLHYNCESNLYEVTLKINEGSATDVGMRAQFNSQISIKVPTGLPLEIMNRYNPIKNNQQYNGTEACNWTAFTPVISPPEDPDHDYYNISPQLIPASFYNNLEEGDEVVLFDCKIGDETEYNNDIRIYDNVNDPTITSSGSDFRNGFAIGAPTQIYTGNNYSSCITSINETSPIDITAYPNPFTNNLTLNLSQEADEVTVYDPAGKAVWQAKNVQPGSIIISGKSLSSGIYTLQVNHADKQSVSKIVKL